MFTRKNSVLAVLTLILVFATQGVASAPVLPNPVLFLLTHEYYTSGGKNYVRYRFDVLNKNDYPNDLFAKSPDLPPCGTNTQAARTWVDFYDQTGKRLQGFCNLAKASDLGTIWFALEEGKLPPSYVYIEMNDRKTNTKYKSNLSETIF
ncbi:MAG TPA: hypothetical protein VGQ41_05165 [Pyrinomonadaceae bacterium]|jgi:hypothetical protein|nr:hypothetical protein [Pyrinomonadaceae bacterium]